ncbi:lysozyme inhibitor [Pantoea agglomerans]|uniref:Lysozyme inhibitor n=1 Tax=Enterobacter agglomerans TaxID=549 RepID=A0A379AGK7_ENTAG|nr:lysozyme inhibitor [Pantoea agglomerans]
MLKGLTVAAVLLLSGCSLMHKQPPSPQTLHYRCGTMPLTVTLDEAQQQVSFIMDGAASDAEADGIRVRRTLQR